MRKHNSISTTVMYFTVAIIVGITSTYTPHAEAAPTLWNGNYYELVMATDISWFDARDEAASLTYGGVSGHLATVSTAAENNFLMSLTPLTYTVTGATAPAGAWLGGRSPDGWLVGPDAGSFSYKNFLPAEDPGYAWMFFGSNYSLWPRGGWGDDVDGIPDSGNPVVGYFVEYEGPISTPEPSTMLLFGFGFIGLVGARRLKQ